MDDPDLTQTRVFVTYLPARSTSGRAFARSLGSLGAPAVTVLASAVFAGGLVHSLGGAGGVTHRDPRVAFDPAPSVRANVTLEALPFLALASTEMAPALDPSGAPRATPPADSRRQRAEAARVKPQALTAIAPVASPALVGRKRLDLEGFLDEQGYALVPEATAAEETSSLAESPAAFVSAPGLALAQGGIAPDAASSPLQGTPPQAEAQTFPTVMVDGVELGAVTMRGDTVHLSSLLGLLELKMPAEEFARLKAAPAADSFVSIYSLRESGLEVTVEADGQSLALAAH